MVHVPSCVLDAGTGRGSYNDELRKRERTFLGIQCGWPLSLLGRLINVPRFLLPTQVGFGMSLPLPTLNSNFLVHNCTSRGLEQSFYFHLGSQSLEQPNKHPRETTILPPAGLRCPSSASIVVMQRPRCRQFCDPNLATGMPRYSTCCPRGKKGDRYRKGRIPARYGHLPSR